MSKKSRAAAAQPRLHFAADEARLPWLTSLLKAYYTTDQGVAHGIRQAGREGRKLACTSGCAACCSHTEIPVYPLELAGIAWFAVEQLDGAVREKVRLQLTQHKSIPSCPFLVDKTCSIRPLRPIACRLFNVVDRACAEGEDAYHTRRGDVLTPVTFYKNKALALMLHDGVPTEAERKARVADRSVHRLAQNLRKVRWENLALRMQGQGQRETGTVRQGEFPVEC
jgi:hypothetical protein